MSKFAPLTGYLRSLPSTECRMSFQEVEEVLGFQLPPSARRHRPWWSNNPHNSAMTKAWLAAEFRTERVDMERETLVFRKSKPPLSGPAAQENRLNFSPRPPLFGGLKGTVRIAVDFDLTQPSGEVWAADQGRP
jgi:hypothetical protein